MNHWKPFFHFALFSYLRTSENVDPYLNNSSEKRCTVASQIRGQSVVA